MTEERSQAIQVLCRAGAILGVVLVSLVVMATMIVQGFLESLCQCLEELHSRRQVR